MPSKDWKQIEEVFHLALQIPPQERDQFLREHCSGSEAIAGEVAKLLEFNDDQTNWEEASTNPQLQQAVSDVVDLLNESSTQEASTLEPLSSTRPAAEFDRTRKERGGIDRAAAELRIHQILARKAEQYEFRKLVGSGGGGTVARVWDKALHRDVAFKVLHSPARKTSRGGRVDRERQQAEQARLLAESRSLAQVQSDYIVQIFEVGEADGTAYLLMEYVNGPSLKSYLSDATDLPPREAAQIARQIASGLVDAHSRGLIHRDIKPSNVLLAKQKDTPEYRVKIIDFGLARVAESEPKTALASAIEGTPIYMPPELLDRSAALSPTADVYSLGVTLYQLLTGTVPFRGAVHMLIKQKRSPVASPSSIDDRVPTDLESVCLKAMAESASERYATVQDFRVDLERFLQGRPTVARPIGIPQRAFKWAARNKAWATAASLLMILFTVLAVGSSVFATVMWNKNLAIERERQQTQIALETQLLSGDSESLLLAIDQFERFALEPVAQLERLANRAETSRARINIACALAMFGEPTQAEIVELVPRAAASSKQSRVLARALGEQREFSLQALEKAYLNAAAGLDHANQIRLATLAWALGNHTRLVELTDASQNASLRTQFIHGLADWCPDLGAAIEQASGWQSKQLSTAIMLGLGCMDAREFTEDENESLQASVRRLHTDPNCPPGLASAARWVARQRRWDLPVSDADSPFYMIEIDPGAFQMGSDDESLLFEGRASHQVKITKPYCIADREVSIEFFRTVLAKSTLDTDVALSEIWRPNETVSPTTAHPAQKVSWFEAVAFCNALSRAKGLQPCYSRLKEPVLLEIDGEKTSFPAWKCDRSANGFRLPTEAEWEYAARASTQTDYSFGNDRHYLEHYGKWTNNRRMSANVSGTLMPNPWGLFDMHGNLWEWTQDWFMDFPTETRIDPMNEKPIAKGRSYRGGGVATFSGDPLSDSRGSTRPDSQFFNVGFRVVRSLSPSN